MSESDLSRLRDRAARGDRDAADELIELAGERGDMDELRRLADTGSTTAADELIQLAAERGDVDELRRLADAGNTTAADQLTELTDVKSVAVSVRLAIVDALERGAAKHLKPPVRSLIGTPRTARAYRLPPRLRPRA